MLHPHLISHGLNLQACQQTLTSQQILNTEEMCRMAKLKSLRTQVALDECRKETPKPHNESRFTLDKITQFNKSTYDAQRQTLCREVSQ